MVHDRVAFLDLENTALDHARLAEFYRLVYLPGFANPDERESLANLADYLLGDPQHAGRHFITLIYIQQRIVGGIIADYLASSANGVIEFLIIDPAYRRQGLAAQLESHMTRRLASAAAAQRKTLHFIAAEIDDPAAGASAGSGLTADARLRVWHRLGYYRVPFAYLQPALSLEQRPVTTLLLMLKPMRPQCKDISSVRLIKFLEDYLSYAMRIADPAVVPEFCAMRDSLAKRSLLRLGL